MRKLLALAAAAGLAIALSSPATAATYDISAAKKKINCELPKNAKNKACKKSEIGSTTLSAASHTKKKMKKMKKMKVDCSIEKNKTNKACKGKTSELGAIDLSAASHVKKMKKPSKAACKKDPSLEGCKTKMKK